MKRNHDNGQRLPWYFSSVPLVSVLWWAALAVVVVGLGVFVRACEISLVR